MLYHFGSSILEKKNDMIQIAVVDYKMGVSLSQSHLQPLHALNCNLSQFNGSGLFGNINLVNLVEVSGFTC
jgi:hypothetical protein